MKDLKWYWFRLRAMGLEEMARHAQKKVRQRRDALRLPNWGKICLEPNSSWVVLPQPDRAPAMLRTTLDRDANSILAGNWTAFGHLTLRVDDPPLWHRDYLVGRDLATQASAFSLNHRKLSDGADVKLIWELSRWNQLFRLAQTAYVLGRKDAAKKCLDWLEDWVVKNPAYLGWNWTSALEAGIRLIQFTWIDGLLAAAQGDGASPPPQLIALRRAILPSHVHYVWRHQSFGSSANNHLLGEIAGLILATLRWPGLSQCGTSIAELQAIWERETLAQFAEDGGNREQALNYQLFSFEFCWQVRLALKASSRSISAAVEGRLADAARFFGEVQVKRDPWDYGDSDSAYVSPWFAEERASSLEWWSWMKGNTPGESIRYWLGDPPVCSPPLNSGSRPEHTICVGEWWIYPLTGIGIHSSGFWWLRWDLSPLGYLQTAAHGHLDALHLSLWLKGVALVVDPGTGAYYADPELRNWLASRAAHNGPVPSDVPEFPRRLGPFLWETHHREPSVAKEGEGTVGVLDLPSQQLRRRTTPRPDGQGWDVDDQCLDDHQQARPFTVCWQFGPDSVVRVVSEREFLIQRAGVELRIVLSSGWEEIRMSELDDADDHGRRPPVRGGLVSSAFRKLERAPFLFLSARPSGERPCVFRTTFLASAVS